MHHLERSFKVLFRFDCEKAKESVRNLNFLLKIFGSSFDYFWKEHEVFFSRLSVSRFELLVVGTETNLTIVIEHVLANQVNMLPSKVARNVLLIVVRFYLQRVKV